MAIPAVALLQQHDGLRDILIEPAARRRTAIEARGHSELGAFGNGRAIGLYVGLSVTLVSRARTAEPPHARIDYLTRRALTG